MSRSGDSAGSGRHAGPALRAVARRLLPCVLAMSGCVIPEPLSQVSPAPTTNISILETTRPPFGLLPLVGGPHADQTTIATFVADENDDDHIYVALYTSRGNTTDLSPLQVTFTLNANVGNHVRSFNATESVAFCNPPYLDKDWIWLVATNSLFSGNGPGIQSDCCTDRKGWQLQCTGQ
jgi:hypothetical protein